MCRWVYNFLVFAYVFAMSVIIIVTLMVVGVRMPELARWLIVVGWVVFCFGGVFIVEVMGVVVLPRCRRPILAEEERLDSLMGEVQRRVGSKMRIRFVICGDAERPTRSLGYRTVLIQSGSLPMASDGELKGVLAHELGHLRDRDRVMEAAFVIAGGFSQAFRRCYRFVRWGFGFSTILGLLVLLAVFMLLCALLPFFLLDGVMRFVTWGLRRQIEYRQDRFAFKAGSGEGLKAWLIRSGLANNVLRIRRLEKMA